EYLTKKNKRILITIDETNNTEAMREFVSEYQRLIRRDLPVFLLMTGLPENISQLQNNEALTFLLRAPKIELEPLDFFRMTDIYRKKLNLSKEKSSEIASLTKGFAYAFQLFGYHTFENNGDYISAISDCKLYLFENVYNKIWEKLSKTDKQILYAIVKNNLILSTKDIREAVNMESNKFSTYRLRLIKKGILAKSEYGYVKFSLPLFEDYIADKMYEEELNEIDLAL
ncbi:MAG: hypothetical protein IJI14_14785, partial [Anaerolineaceae bacterium]|nr:hypothetical protein [Anaerolineaceae bacterium]